MAATIKRRIFDATGRTGFLSVIGHCELNGVRKGLKLGLVSDEAWDDQFAAEALEMRWREQVSRADGGAGWTLIEVVAAPLLDA